MKYEEIGNQEGKTLLLLPRANCTCRINFFFVLDALAEKYRLILVDYDGLEGERGRSFTDIPTVAKKIEDYVIENYDGRVDGVYGCALGASVVCCLLMNDRIHMDKVFIGGADFEKGNPISARFMSSLVTRGIKGAARPGRKRDSLKGMLMRGFGMTWSQQNSQYIDDYIDCMTKLSRKTIYRQTYSDYVTHLEKGLHVDGTEIHVIYSVKMGLSYENRYLQYFRDPVIHKFDMQHEEWLFNSPFTPEVLETICECMDD